MRVFILAISAVMLLMCSGCNNKDYSNSNKNLNNKVIETTNKTNIDSMPYQTSQQVSETSDTKSDISINSQKLFIQSNYEEVNSSDLELEIISEKLSQEEYQANTLDPIDVSFSDDSPYGEIISKKDKKIILIGTPPDTGYYGFSYNNTQINYFQLPYKFGENLKIKKLTANRSIVLDNETGFLVEIEYIDQGVDGFAKKAKVLKAIKFIKPEILSSINYIDAYEDETLKIVVVKTDKSVEIVNFNTLEAEKIINMNDWNTIKVIDRGFTNSGTPYLFQINEEKKEIRKFDILSHKTDISKVDNNLQGKIVTVSSDGVCILVEHNNKNILYHTDENFKPIEFLEYGYFVNTKDNTEIGGKKRLEGISMFWLVDEAVDSNVDRVSFYTNDANCRFMFNDIVSGDSESEWKIIR